MESIQHDVNSITSCSSEYPFQLSSPKTLSLNSVCYPHHLPKALFVHFLYPIWSNFSDPNSIRMRFTILPVLATTTLAAGDSVISLFIPDTDPQPLVASIVAQVRGRMTMKLTLEYTGSHSHKNSATTSLSVNCPSGTKSEICGMGPGLFLTTAPTSVEYLISDSAGGM